MKTVLLLYFVSLFCTNACLGADEFADSPALNVHDIMALLDASFAKVRIKGAPDSNIILSILDKNGRVITKTDALLMGPSGVADLCICARNSSGFLTRKADVELVFTWSAPPQTRIGKLTFKKFWNFREGKTYTSGRTDDSFNSILMNWNSLEVPTVEVTRILWLKKEVSPPEVAMSEMKVGTVVLATGK